MEERKERMLAISSLTDVTKEVADLIRIHVAGGR
jgi:hypothetical protein